jgi:hypothetical protein
MTKKELLEMKIGETKFNGSTGIERVFGGWIYMFHDQKNDIITSSCFVPEELNCNTRSVN